ncbi:acetyl-CoA carboxylase biotin carboxyl carrier protein subunit [Caballeronia pedi]|uniref:Biotin carboxyl carrier protein of acetyl-CoA carboxylase n=1 Tax=Caballeronia pedi TaxID=1777141 RepID=A0A157ZRG8_9BURK|nr:acetyl-CoA carboxylase [Caballeronia pedi]SAK48091.1 acetyl-CoA carboxylase biotin carboxyl carrier protein subunit [Caballeronia pedi]
MADIEVTSPVPGTFYRSPAPGEPPFVSEGQKVTAETIIGNIELMKQFNEVFAGTAGTLKAFVVSDGDAVDSDAVIAIISTD